LTSFQPVVWTPDDSRKGAVVIKILPDSPSLEHLRNQAKTLLEVFRAGDANAVQRVRAISSAEPFKLSHAQFVIAREYGFQSWTRLKARVERPIKLSKRKQFVRDLANELLILASSDVVALAAQMAIPLRDIFEVRAHLLETKRLHLLVDGLLLGLENSKPKVRADCATDAIAVRSSAESSQDGLTQPVVRCLQARTARGHRRFGGAIDRNDFARFKHSCASCRPREPWRIMC
jgi:hypothetical protein